MPEREDALWALIEARDASIARLRAVEAEQHAALLEKERVIHDKEAVLQHNLEEVMKAKEAVIREQREAIEAYRAAFAALGGLIKPLNRVVLTMGSLLKRCTLPITPRIGVLHQYPPRTLRLPPAAGPRPAGREAPPRIALVTPSFRQAMFIERTIASVLDQHYPALDYFVQDGASEDGTREILERYAGRIGGWDSRPDKGQSEAINRAFRHTRGEIMGWLNSDDILLPGALDCVASYFQHHPEVDVVYGHRVLIDEEDREIGRWMMPAHDDAVLSWADYVPQETLFWRRRIWDKAGGRIDESFRFAMDWDLLVRFREAGARFARIPRYLGGFRVHPHQKTSAGISDVGFKEMDRIRERVLGRVPTRTEVRRALAPYLLRHIALDLPRRVRDRLGMQA